ncbi:F-box protein [Candidatus Dependentiae bacterium]|nr:F-box protein [Candidatus Dependentiae bacterium]
MLRYILSLLFLLVSTNIFCMESGETKFTRDEDSSLVALPDEVKMHIFKMVATPKDAENPKEIAKSKKDIQSLRRVCKSFNELFKDEEFKKLENNLYQIDYFDNLYKSEKVTNANIGRTETAVKHNVLPFLSYCLSKNNKTEHFEKLFEHAYKYNKDFMDQLGSGGCDDISVVGYRKKFDSIPHSELMDWIRKNKFQYRRNNLGLRAFGNALSLVNVSDFFASQAQ